MHSPRRRCCAIALALLLSVLAGDARARSFKLVAGDPEKCAPYQELMSHPVIGRYQHNWYPGGERGFRSIGDYGVLTVIDQERLVALLVERWPRPAPENVPVPGSVPTFQFRPYPQVSPRAASVFAALPECRRLDDNRNACVLDEGPLARKFRLPALNATRMDASYGGPAKELGNSYYFYWFKDRYWLTISPLGNWTNPVRSLFGFALNAPGRVFSGQADSLFEFGCQVEGSYR